MRSGSITPHFSFLFCYRIRNSLQKGLTNTGSENYGGGVVTAGGLFFIGATNYDANFHAFDKSHVSCYGDDAASSRNATPVVYEAGERQFVLVGAGGGKNSKALPDGSYVAFALPQNEASK
ncbi:hypothetical protein JAO29_05950 [Edaphobacter sp. HDX4]|uniref:hypothetical protein n=1 Tax=Edaphobacter sp. HDX4 TaxID=2794064 RepID=UPI002FE58976